MGPVVIVGGGIGGLAVAVGLRREGIPVAVYERAPELREIGAAVGLEAGALNAMSALGLSDGLRKIASVPWDRLRVVSHTGKQLAVWPRFQASAAVHRAELLALLREALGDDSVIHCGRKCVDFRQDSDGATAIFEDGGEATGSVLIGADGLHSAVRKALWGDSELRYGGYTEWRAIADRRFEEVPDGSPMNVLGPGGVFGMSAVSKNRTMWFCKIGRPQGAGDPAGGRKQDVLDTFGGWAHPIRAVIESTPEPAIDRRDVFDRKPLKRWSGGRVTLLGDAAHPTTPSLGAGAGMTIEDASALARAIADVEDRANPRTVEAALRLYERQRIPLTSKVVTASRRFSKVVCARAPAAIKTRNTLLPLIPEQYWRRQVEQEVLIDLSSKPRIASARSDGSLARS